MKKYLLLYCGIERSGDSIPEWIAWFEANGEHFIDSGNPLLPGRWVAGGAGSDLPDSADAVGAYSLVQAETLADAERIASTCPAVAGVQVFEALPM